MDIFLADDAGQPKPSRPGMGPLLAIGGVYVPDESVQQLEVEIEALCLQYEFPPNEIFKWSPARGLWMHQKLVGKQRQDFFTHILGLAKDNKVKATVIINDISCNTATKAQTHEIDLIQLLLERVHHQLFARQCNGMVIVSQPGGGRSVENKFLADCVATLKCGTDYVKPDRIALSVLSCPPRFIRLLQLADVVTSCTTAYVAGEKKFSPPIFNAVKPILATEMGRIGGVGLKIHPDYKYLNLYHWLVGDSHFIRFMEGWPFPLVDHPYSSDPYVP
jgi:hypothetical protein